jgi:hypothetical protein
MQLNTNIKYALLHYNVATNKVRFMITHTKSTIKTINPYNELNTQQTKEKSNLHGCNEETTLGDEDAR